MSMLPSIAGSHHYLHPVYYGLVAVFGGWPYNLAAGALCVVTGTAVYLHIKSKGLSEDDDDDFDLSGSVAA